LPRHNSSTQLPAELPDELLRAPFAWLRRGGVVPPLHRSFDGPYAVLRSEPLRSGRGTRLSPSATSRPARKRMQHLVVRDTTADHRASAQVVPLPPSGSHFQTRWFPCLPLLRRRQATVQEPFFRSRTGFLHALYRRRHPSLHSSGTRTISSHSLRD
jgi:hypothetical protein